MQLTREQASPASENVVRLASAHPERVADRWLAATRFESLRGRAFAHPMFASFAALGENAISVALRRLVETDEAELWLDVLDEIADGPERTDADVDALVAAWSGWARDRRLVT
jgi:hypothetical protein